MPSGSRASLRTAACSPAYHDDETRKHDARVLDDALQAGRLSSVGQVEATAMLQSVLKNRRGPYRSEVVRGNQVSRPPSASTWPSSG